MTPADCHPKQRHYGRGLCKPCYDHHAVQGTLTDHPYRRWKLRVTEFADEYRPLRSSGFGRTAIAERLGVTRNAVDAAYVRAIRAGLLDPDRRTA